MFIDGVGIAGYRSFGQEIQRIGPFGKVNLMVGRNNSGKSNILLFLRDHYGAALKREKLGFNDLDYHEGNKTAKQMIEVGLRIDGENYKKIIERLEEIKNPRENLPEIVGKVLQSQALTKGTSVVWFRYVGEGRNAIDTELLSEIYEERVIINNQWSRLSELLSGLRVVGEMSKDVIKNKFILETLKWLSPCNLLPPIVSLVPAIRRVSIGEDKANDFSGIGIIDKLARLQNAPYNEPEKRTRFERINVFVQNVLSSSSATIHVPYERDTIEVEMDGRALPLNNLGTGVHEVIILAAAATVLERQVVCIEEPELHCHPLLQKQLVKYLHEKTDNQYFISTHSAHLLDTAIARVFHVRLCEGDSMVESVITDADRAGICVDLGYRASDLVQANCVIWVEGPSDRIYLNHWILSISPKLIEGVHYSIMFYGGRLLKHLSADDPEVGDFISLRRLNRHIAIVIDSDRSGPRKRINKTKMRVRGEFDKGLGFAWITKGREIENYIDVVILENAVKNVHPKINRLTKKGIYENRLKYGKIVEDEGSPKIDKVKVAREVVKSKANLAVLDLKEQIVKLVKFIKESNGIGD